MSTKHPVVSPRPSAPTFFLPSCLTTLSARAVARCLTYEDYEDCCHYRWDPVNIWQYEIPHKKKKGKKASERSQMFTVNEAAVPPPKPAWQEIRKFRDWWWQTSILGSMDSVLRGKIFTAFEQLSWTARTEEEFILFLLLRICIETKIELGNEPFEIQSEWCTDLAQILNQLGPFPLLKLYVTHESLGLKPLLISLVQQSPHLQVLHVNQWALSNDFMTALGSHCRLLTEFSIPHMQPQVFMSDEALFACFFDGLGSEAVQRCWQEGGKTPPLSFSRLKVVDILYWKQTQRFIQMLACFYPNVRLRDIDVHFFETEPNGIASPFLEVGAKVPAMGATFRLGDICWEKLSGLVKHTPYLRELRITVDSNTDGFTSDPEARMEEAGVRLEKLVTQMTAFESLAVRHNSLASIVPAFQPALRARGDSITSLHLCCETRMESNAVYKMVNLCPRLCVLVLTVPLGEEELSSGCRTVLHPCQSLDTLAVLNSGWASLPEDPYPFKVVHRVLEAAHNLQTLGLSCTMAMKDDISTLSSDSLRSLHLQFASEPETPSDLLMFLGPLLPNFPHLRTLSLDEKYAQFPLEAVAPLLRTGIDVTKWVPEFLHPSKWEFPSESSNIFNF